MAMANGMPVVSTPYHFALEVIQDTNGIIVPYKDHNSTLLAKALSTLLEDDALRKEMVRSIENVISSSAHSTGQWVILFIISSL